jgi:hypothetical protein
MRRETRAYLDSLPEGYDEQGPQTNWTRGFEGDNDQFNNDTNPQSSGGQSKNPRDTNTQWDHTAEPDDGDH